MQALVDPSEGLPDRPLVKGGMHLFAQDAQVGRRPSARACDTMAVISIEWAPLRLTRAQRRVEGGVARPSAFEITNVPLQGRRLQAREGPGTSENQRSWLLRSRFVIPAGFRLWSAGRGPPFQGHLPATGVNASFRSKPTDSRRLQ